jgi:hypothetical protein
MADIVQLQWAAISILLAVFGVGLFFIPGGHALAWVCFVVGLYLSTRAWKSTLGKVAALLNFAPFVGFVALWLHALGTMTFH